MRKLVIIVLLGTATTWLSADPVAFESIINFEGSIRTLSEHVRSGRDDRIDTERYFILEGVVASTQVFDPDPASFQALIELVSSNWVGLERIEVYRVYVLVEGSEYADRLPERLPRDLEPHIITANQKLLVVGPFIGTASLEDGEVPVVLAVKMR